MSEHLGNRRALVLGGLGFIGSNLSRRLAELGARVTILTPSRAQDPVALAAHDTHAVRILEGDLRDSALMREATAGQELVFHLAARSGAVRSLEDPWTDLDVNCRGTLVLLEALRDAASTAKVVFMGSRLAYGRAATLPVNEDAALEPSSLYGIHKATGEMYLSLYRRLFGVPSTVARVTNAYGPGQPLERTAYGVANRMIQIAIARDAITVYGDGAQQRDYIYVDDVVEALLALARSPHSNGRVYNVGAGIGTSFVAMARRVIDIAGGGRIEHVDWPDLARQIETGDFIADISRIVREIGWRPVVSLDEGLRRTVNFYRTGGPMHEPRSPR